MKTIQNKISDDKCIVGLKPGPLPPSSCEKVGSRAPQFKKVSLGSEVGSKTDQNKPFRLGLRSFASKLMDRDSIKVFAFGGNQSPKNWKTEMG